MDVTVDAVTPDAWIVDADTSDAPIMLRFSICTEDNAGYKDQSAVLDRSPALASSSLLKYKLEPMDFRTCEPDASMSVICPVWLGNLYQLEADSPAKAKKGVVELA